MELIGLLIQNTGSTQSPVNTYQVTKPNHDTFSDSDDPLTKPALTETHMASPRHSQSSISKRERERGGGREGERRVATLVEAQSSLHDLQLCSIQGWDGVWKMVRT